MTWLARGLGGIIVLTALVAPVATVWAQMAKYPAGFSHTVLAGSLDNPTAFAFFPDGRIAVAEKVGIVRLVKDGQLQPTPLVDIRDRVNDYWDRGLIGIAVDPDFGNRPYVYLFYSYEHRLTDYFGTKVGRVSRMTVSGDTAEVTALLEEAVREGVATRFARIEQARKDAAKLGTVEADRERVEAELGFEVYVHGLHAAAEGTDPHAEGEAVAAAEGKAQAVAVGNHQH